MYEKTNFPGYMKDKQTGMVINTSVDEYEQILAHREKQKKEKEMKDKVLLLSDELKEVKSDLKELKDMLRKALNID